MGFTATYPRPAKTHPTAKNRVWGFLAQSNRSRPANRLQPPEPRRRIHSTATKTASGVSVYGFRYYDPSTGRWISRDPIAERGGVNLYGFVSNNALGMLDLLGKVPTEYDPPDPSQTPVRWGNFVDEDGDPRDDWNAGTRSRVEVTCECYCPEEGKNAGNWLIRCGVETSFQIILAHLAGPNPTGQGVNGELSDQPVQDPWEQIVGHEQKHVQSRIAQAQMVVDEENGKNPRLDVKYTNPEDCDKGRSDKEGSLEERIREKWRGHGGDNHQHGPGKPWDGNANELSPIDGVGYPPLEGTPPLPNPPPFP